MPVKFLGIDLLVIYRKVKAMKFAWNNLFQLPRDYHIFIYIQFITLLSGPYLTVITVNILHTRI